MNKEYIIRTRLVIMGAECIRFQNGRSRRCTELYSEPVFLNYVLLENRSYIIKSYYVSDISIVDDYDFIDLYFNYYHYKVYSPEVMGQRKYII